VVPHGLDVVFPFVFCGDFRSPILVIFLVRFRDLALGDLVGEVCVNEDQERPDGRWMTAPQ
jgi:hypothetical protein